MNARELYRARRRRYAALADQRKATFGPGAAALQWQTAKRDAHLLHQWRRLEALGLVKLKEVPDDTAQTWEDLECDSYDLKHASTVPGGERTIKAQQKRFRKKVEQDGVWGVVGYYRLHKDDCWEHGDSVWGFAGYDDPLDLEENDYVRDIIAGTLAEFRRLVSNRCPRCRQPLRRKEAA